MKFSLLIILFLYSRCVMPMDHDDTLVKTTISRLSGVIGGVETTIEKWPFIVTIYRNGKLCCAGTMIDLNWVLTSAHSLRKKFEPKDFDILPGQTTVNALLELTPALSVVRIIPHEKWQVSDPTRRFDIGLMKTKNQFTLSPKVQPIPYATYEMNKGLDPTELSKNATIIGWGATTRDETLIIGKVYRLRYAVLPLITNEECLKRVSMGIIAIDDKVLCTLDPTGEKASNHGDSGGPLVWNTSGINVLQGVVSHGDGEGKPDIFTRVDAFEDWIKNHMSHDMRMASGNRRSWQSKSNNVLTVSFIFLISYFVIQ